MLPRFSGVDCPSVDPRQPLCSPLSCPVSTALRGLQPQLPFLLSSHQLSLCSPATNSLSALQPPTPSRVQPPTLLSPVQLPTVSLWVEIDYLRRQLSFASPYHFRVRRDFFSKNPLSGFAPKQTRLLWRPTPIVLHTHTHTHTHTHIHVSIYLSIYLSIYIYIYISIYIYIY